MKERGITQRQLAAGASLTPQSISNYIRGTRNLPGAEELFLLAKYFGASMESLIGDPGLDVVEDFKKAAQISLTHKRFGVIVARIERICEELSSLVEELKESKG